MKDNIENLITQDFSKKEFKSPILKSLMFLTPKRIIGYEKIYKIYSIIFSVFILILGGIFSCLNGVLPFFLFFTEILQEYAIFSQNLCLFSAIFFVINFIVYYFINEVICRVIFKKKENSVKFFISYSTIFFPMLIYLVIHYIFSTTNILGYSTIGIIDNILLIFFQVWSLWLLTFNLNVNKYLKIENSLIISLLIHYAGFSIILALTI